MSAADLIEFSKESVIKVIEDLSRHDDVFCLDFVTETFLVDVPQAHSTDVQALFSGLPYEGLIKGTTWCLKNVLSIVAPHKNGHSLPSGPYFLKNRCVHEAWRLYTDDYDCFQTTITPCPTSPAFRVLNSVSMDGAHKCVAVPSRLYFKQSPDKPLGGLRIAIKDNYALKGIKTSLGNRSFFETYPAEQHTAAYAQRLLDLGGVIVGKTKLAAFASSEKPCDWWDYLCPFNPRGDMHLTPGQSSTGSAAASAAYAWLDIAVGSDSKPR